MKLPLTPYVALGHAIAVARAAKSIETQSDLALLINASQQSVSRWEAGSHRPGPGQLAALATVLDLSMGDLLRLAGYDAPPAKSFVAQLPVDRFVRSETFEQFVAYLVGELHRGASVRRTGGSGHAQDGVDVVAELPDGRRIGYQCKHVQRFGPAEVRAAVSALQASRRSKGPRSQSSRESSGGLGIPTFVLLCKVSDWHWRDDRSNSLWYPALSFFVSPLLAIGLK